MIWRIYPKGGSSVKWYISGQLWNGTPVRLPGFSDAKQTEALMRNIESLNRSKMFGETPAESLAEWIQNLPQKEAERYVHYGLLDQRYVEKRRHIDELLADYMKALLSNCKDESTSPKVKVKRIRRIFTAIGADTKYDDLTPTKVNEAVRNMAAITGRWKGKLLSQKSRCEYLSAIKSFCYWMVSQKKAAVNVLATLNTSGAHRAPVRKRRPMTVEDFRKLVAYLQSAPQRPRMGRLKWTPQDRLIIYWTAVMTGLRAKELASLTPANLNFASKPATVTVDGWVSKNQHSTTIPIDDELGEALQRYAVGTAPDQLLFRIVDLNSLRFAFYRDLDNAGIRRTFDDGATIDFHTLRSTAICWWLTENKLDLIHVQHRARLKTLELVQKYVDDFMPKHADLVKGTPKFFDSGASFQQPHSADGGGV